MSYFCKTRHGVDEGQTPTKACYFNLLSTQAPFSKAVQKYDLYLLYLLN
jgi:hypothetical protein